MRNAYRLMILAAILPPTLTFSVTQIGLPSFCAWKTSLSTHRPCHARAATGSWRTPISFRGLALRAQQRTEEFDAAAKVDDASVEKLFAWLNCAFAGDGRYNNLMLAFAAIFGEDAEDSVYGGTLAALAQKPGAQQALGNLVDAALAQLPPEDEAVGPPYSLREREKGCLGAMGAGQWTGQYRTRPHALLDVRQFASVEDWVQGLPRGARRTLIKANSQNFRVFSRPIYGDKPAPHSSLAHFRCVVAHEVRLLADSPDEFFDALGQAIGRYQNCITQGGEIREYRDASGRVIAFAQEATKGKVMRGQWFYSTDAGSKSFVWFHSVQELVRRAIEDDDVDFADLGPSGSDAFSELKAKYGFASVADWHTVADYRGPFRYSFGSGESWAQLDPPDYLFAPPSFADQLLGKDLRGL